jgi:hypothetical protein
MDMATVVQVQRVAAQGTFYGTSTEYGTPLQSVENGRKPKTGIRRRASTATSTRQAPTIPPKPGSIQSLRNGMKTPAVEAKQPAKLDKALPAIPRESTITIPLAISKSVAGFSPYLQHKHSSSLDSRPDESSVATSNVGTCCSQTKPPPSQQLHSPPNPTETFELLKPTVFESRNSPRAAQSPSTVSEISPLQISNLADSPPHLSWTPFDDFVVTPTSAAPSSPSRVPTSIKPLETSISSRNLSTPPSKNTPDPSQTPTIDDYDSGHDFPSPLLSATITQPMSPLSCPPPYFESEPTTALEQYSSFPNVGSKPSKLPLATDISPASPTPQKVAIRKKENRQTPTDILVDWRSSTSSDLDHHFPDDSLSATIDPAKEYHDLLAGLPPYSFTRPQSFVSFKSSRPTIMIPSTPRLSPPQQINLEKPLPIPDGADFAVDDMHLKPKIYHSHSDSNASATATILPSYTDPTPPVSPADEETARSLQLGKFPYEQPIDSSQSSNTILPAPPLRNPHYDCYTSHRHMVPSRNVLHAVACMTCGKEDAESRWKCSWCCLRACKECMPKLDAAGRGKVSRYGEGVLQRMLDSLAKT